MTPIRPAVSSSTSSRVGIPSSRSSVAAAQKDGCDVAVLVAGHNCKPAAEAAANIAGVATVLLADHAANAHGLAENLAPLVARLAPAYSHVFAATTSFGKNLMPRVAALLDVAQVSDIVAVESADTFVRPIYAGNALATVQSKDTVKIVTVRGTAFAAAAPSGGSAAVETVAEAGAEAGLSSFVKSGLSKSERPELTSARIIVSGGRGMGSGENFRILEALADRLGAAVGASRAASALRIQLASRHSKESTGRRMSYRAINTPNKAA